MSKKKAMISTKAEVEKVFLIGLLIGQMKRAEAEASFEELRRLAGSTTGLIVGEQLANVRIPSPATLITDGIVEQLGALLAATNADTAVIDEEITATQQRNLENRWNVKVLTRSELILDIFAGRARTSEGKLQVELAQLQYRLPRLRGHGVELSRLGGGIGTRGPGEMKLETDRRAIEERIHLLEQRILKLRRQRDTQRARRQGGPVATVALVGYTNAGKSTLLNALTGAEAFAENKLFATLDPLTRRARLPSGQFIALTDTVGFINRLPTQLAAAFRATLEEVQYADLLIHVVDVTSLHWEEELKVTEGVLKDLGAGGTPKVVAWNKFDAVEEPEEAMRYFERRHKPCAVISARTGEGLDRLQTEIETVINASRPQMWLKIDYRQYRDVNYLESNATVHQLVHREDGIYILASLTPEIAARYESCLSSPPPAE